jgi:molecular chaperone DnaK
MKLGEAVYKSQQKPDANKAEGAKPNDKENVVDADFEDVKEKEEDKEKSA